MEKYVCIHGHFYQPPRENPWLEEVEVQDSAWPYHDWNERITAECYAPNAASRILDGEGKIVNIVNNYASISLNFGPTLLSWLAAKSREVYDRLLEADRTAQGRFSGHGTAIAQVYNHMIMPLANDRDKYTQALWGLRDFEFRFRRRPEGMWLAETAVDLPTLEALAALGIRFTILAPHQAARIRPLSGGDWVDVSGGKIDPTRAYLQRLPSGKSIALFFYDGPISRAVAFESLLDQGDVFASRLLGGFSPERKHAQLVHIATDGESYGHHHAHGDMGLAYAIHKIEQNPDVRLTVYGEFLEKHPPQYEVDIVENTSWSCFHGIERWRSDCGCSGGRAGWHQRWRQPLREALDWLRDAIAEPFEQMGQKLLQDPWQARNDYIGVILDRSPGNVDEFLLDQATRPLGEAEKVAALKLMELQRHAMLMYTSCGWFFDDISGIETVQIIAYAGRVLQLAEELFGRSWEAEFLERLERAESNVPEHKNGRVVYEKFVKPSVVGWNEIGAHYAVSSLFEDYGKVAKVFCYTAEREDFTAMDAGRVHLATGRVRLTSQITTESQMRSFGVIHFGDHNVSGGICKFDREEEYRQLVEDLRAAMDRADLPQVLRIFDRGFGESIYSLKSLFRDKQREIVDRLLQESQFEAEAAYRKLYEESLPTMRFLADLNMPLPKSFRTATEFIIQADLQRAIRDDEPDLERIKHLFDEAKRWNVSLDEQGLAFQLTTTLRRMARRFAENPSDLASLLKLEQVVQLATSLPFTVDLWEPQNVYFRLLETVYPELENKAYGDEASQAWLEHFQDLGERLGVQVAELKKKIRELKSAPSFNRILDDIFTRTRIPVATYRLQLNRDFPFAQAKAVVPYLYELGISDVYLSPILQASPGSPHGYDVIDHSRINTELGGEDGFHALSAELKLKDMGIVLDVVPNHMGIGHSENHWWQDVLENGPSSEFAHYFDIDWDPVNPNLRNKVLLPVLGNQYGAVLERGEIELSYADGAFYFAYYDHRFPVAPCTYDVILQHRLATIQDELGPESEEVQELKSILTAVRHLPDRRLRTPEIIAERAREKEIIKRRIAALVERSAVIREQLELTLKELNGRTSDPSSFDRLDSLLSAQVVRPAFWRVAAEEINYRRFFDVNHLAAIRVEVPDVFDATHRVVLDLLGRGAITGLRVDHPDGLWNPTSYFRHLQETFVERRIRSRLGLTRLTDDMRREIQKRLRAAEGTSAAAKPLFIVAEKILAHDEELPSDWAVHGTTGYDALNQLNGLSVDPRGLDELTSFYHAITGRAVEFSDVAESSKRMIMLVSLASEINSLSHSLDRISERNRRYRDFTLNSLTFAIREIIAALDVYRTYITGPEVSERDRNYIEAAVADAKQRNPRTAAAIFDFIRDTLLLRNLGDFQIADQPEVLAWVMRFQQITGPVTAKGIEDTAFYIYNRLVSTNEVGGHPDAAIVGIDDFHTANAFRREHWPHSMVATSTHDTKRSEDVRARLNVLSEIPNEWAAAVERWRKLNAAMKSRVGKTEAPSANDEYLLYQTLVGTWPARATDRECMGCYRRRIVSYMLKAIHEAKVHTSWVNPNHEYDGAVRRFVEKLLPDDANSPFVEDLARFAKKVTHFGWLNSLSQTLLKTTVPGVPDIYQGTEFWDDSLVDPDNRRPVDFHRRAAVLQSLKARAGGSLQERLALLRDLVEHMGDGRIKLYVLWQALELRKRYRDVFNQGEYVPLAVTGAGREHVVAFLRRQGENAALVAVPRFCLRLLDGRISMPLGEAVWGDARVSLGAVGGEIEVASVLSGEQIPVQADGGEASIRCEALFRHLPVFLGVIEGLSLPGADRSD